MNCLGSTNFVLHAKSNQFYWEGNGQLSIKTFSNGKAHYKTSKGFFAVEESRYLLLNEGSYTISIDENKDVESFCIFFKDGFAEEILNSLRESNNKLLSDPFNDKSYIGFFEKTYDTSKILLSQMTKFKENLSILENDPVGYEEQFHKLMQIILIEHFNTWKEVESLSALRNSTREELYRRISIAHDYIRSYYDKAIKLNDIAQVACLSPNHLLRTYSQIYGKTPHQHISEFRILKAKKLLTQLDFNMTDITFELGLQNPVSFSKMFKQHVGVSPIEFRKKVILDKKY
ncbi:AraC family transcriptional regulator [Bacillus wiedmannii]|uniref:helix-turn-helix domain-containing protein n=1 Tax=Bacillus wiedmannii TaxID=1890302 RepID=UPI000BEFD5CB|nr:AraC family transcriptional regulator [Bacillus wiedmannii]PEK03769.1 AraC family transcriptional regulator [Bacillus wiedmannii]PEL83673.1 AraC family transcriptional regulator [Bacillus wiedmannii]PEM28539.1 AraC family transcriptional regulator [Bacillus wiedmannii]PEM84572.1 AraC family transcriptional regulator [Bacillus wiedmannii]PEO84925.1 AraC family transcriptional regulator [Bacillus wiedmannii]